MSTRPYEPPDDLFDDAPAPAQLTLVPEAPPSQPPVSEGQLRAAQSLLQFVAPKLNAKPSRGKASVGPAERKKLQDQAVEMGRSGNWEGARPGHLVALYMWLHEGLYGVLPGELEVGTTFVIASHHAKRCLDTHFGGKYLDAVAFLQWAWKRESWRHQHRRSEDTFRITWKYQFGGGMVTDWKIEQARAHSA